MDTTKLRKWALMTAGILSIGLAVFGIFIPVLPTTPFLLLAAACFVRSSPRLYTWLLRHKWFGAYIRHYREERAITVQAKIVTLLLLWGMIGYTSIWIVSAWWLRVLLGIIAGGVTWHILAMRTLTRDTLRAEAELTV